MKYIRQFLIILGISLLGELLKDLIPLPIPASIYGLIIVLIALKTKLLKLEQIKEASRFLIEIMPLMFIPAAVGLLVSWQALKAMLIPVSIIVVISTILVMGITGRVTQLMIRMDGKKK